MIEQKIISLYYQIPIILIEWRHKIAFTLGFLSGEATTTQRALEVFEILEKAKHVKTRKEANIIEVEMANLVEKWDNQDFTKTKK